MQNMSSGSWSIVDGWCVRMSFNDWGKGFAVGLQAKSLSSKFHVCLTGSKGSTASWVGMLISVLLLPALLLSLCSFLLDCIFTILFLSGFLNLPNESIDFDDEVCSRKVKYLQPGQGTNTVPSVYRCALCKRRGLTDQKVMKVYLEF